jgi:hypothetical protein
MMMIGQKGIVGMLPQSIQDKGLVGSLFNKLGSAAFPGAEAAPVRPPTQAALPRPTGAGGGMNFSAADYDNAPTTPADWAGTRADFLQDRAQDSGLLGHVFGGGGA